MQRRDARSARGVPEGCTVLGIDAAWTVTQPSGVALVEVVDGRWSCRALAPSYAQFIGLARGIPVDWSGTPRGSTPAVADLVRAAEQLSLRRQPVHLVAIDMPLSLTALTGRRAADRAVTSQFARRYCGTHSPTPDRPGDWGASLTRSFVAAGYRLATRAADLDGGRHLLEVYPHPALLALLNVPLRFEYKTSRSGRFWPEASVAERVRRLLEAFRTIEVALRQRLGPTSLPLPKSTPGITLSGLKRYEDALDALVCCWIGTECLARRFVPYGDATGAIWCPPESALPPPVGRGAAATAGA